MGAAEAQGGRVLSHVEGVRRARPRAVDFCTAIDMAFCRTDATPHRHHVRHGPLLNGNPGVVFFVFEKGFILKSICSFKQGVL